MYVSGEIPYLLVAGMVLAMHACLLGPLAPESVDSGGQSHGVLAVICDSTADAVVYEAIVDAYATDGVQRVHARPVWEPDENWVDFGPPIVNTSSVLGDDDLLIGDESMYLTSARHGQWGVMESVKSRRWELTPAGEHPLALRLSRRWPVLALTWTLNIAHELCLYRRGAPVSYAACGRPAEPAPVDVPFDFDWLAPLCGATGQQLRSRFCDPVIFAQQARLPAEGFASIFDPRPLEDYPDAQLLAVRRDPREPGGGP